MDLNTLGSFNFADKKIQNTGNYLNGGNKIEFSTIYKKDFNDTDPHDLVGTGGFSPKFWGTFDIDKPLFQTEIFSDTRPYLM